MRFPIVIAKNAKINENKEITNFDSIRVYESAFERKQFDKINFEGDSWTVIGLASNIEKAIELKNSVVSDFKKAGYKFSTKKNKF